MGLGKIIGEMGGSAAGALVKESLEGVGGLARDLRAAITGKESIPPEVQVQLAEIADRLEKRAHEGVMAQVEMTKAEQETAGKLAASSPKWAVFVGGWRPGIGWVCALALATYYLPQHVMAAILWTKQSWAAQIIQPYPITGGDLMELVLALLGMGLLRSADKRAGVAAK